jgi:hypothetical protein
VPFTGGPTTGGVTTTQEQPQIAAVQQPQIEEAAMPAAARPTQAEPGPGAKFLSGLSDSLASHPLMLMALGAGFAGAPSLGTGMSRAFSGATSAAAADQKQQIQLQGISNTYKALVARGVPAHEALAAVYNPDVMKAVAAKYFEAKPLTWNEGIGSDPYTGEIKAVHPGKIEKVVDPNGIERSVVRIGGRVLAIDPNKLEVLGEQPKQVTSMEEALSLPKGTRFTDPFGKVRVR